MGEICLFLKTKLQWTSNHNGFCKWWWWTKYKMKLQINKFIFVSLKATWIRVWVKNILIFDIGTREVWGFGFTSWFLHPFHPILCTHKIRGWWVSVPLWKLEEWVRTFLSLSEIKRRCLSNRSVTVLQHSL